MLELVEKKVPLEVQRLLHELGTGAVGIGYRRTRMAGQSIGYALSSSFRSRVLRMGSLLITTKF
jgi:hypothetical protein